MTKALIRSVLYGTHVRQQPHRVNGDFRPEHSRSLAVPDATLNESPIWSVGDMILSSLTPFCIHPSYQCTRDERLIFKRTVEPNRRKCP